MRSLLQIFLNGAALWFVSVTVPGIRYGGGPFYLCLTGLAIGLVNLLIASVPYRFIEGAQHADVLRQDLLEAVSNRRVPRFHIISGVIFGVVHVVINSLMLVLLAWLLTDLSMEGWLPAILGGIILASTSWLVSLVANTSTNAKLNDSDGIAVVIRDAKVLLRFYILRAVFVFGFALDFIRAFIPSRKNIIFFFGPTDWMSQFETLRLSDNLGQGGNWVHFAAIAASAGFAILGIKHPSRGTFILGALFSVYLLLQRWGLGSDSFYHPYYPLLAYLVIPMQLTGFLIEPLSNSKRVNG